MEGADVIPLDKIFSESDLDDFCRVADTLNLMGYVGEHPEYDPSVGERIKWSICSLLRIKIV